MRGEDPGGSQCKLLFQVRSGLEGEAKDRTVLEVESKKFPFFLEERYWNVANADSRSQAEETEGVEGIIIPSPGTSWSSSRGVDGHLSEDCLFV